MKLFLSTIAAGMPLLLVEYASRRYKLTAEHSRKLVHSLSCVVVLWLPLWLNVHQIAVIAAVFCVVLTMSHGLRTWRSLYGIQRRSWGEVAFAASVLVASLLAHTDSVFIAAIAVMGLADPVAALVGRRYGQHHILGTHKTLEGSLGFYGIAVSLLLLTGSSPLIAVSVGLIATIAEAYSSYGLDNVSVPLSIVILLNVA